MTSRVTATLRSEREGEMLLVLGARHLGTGEVFFSELLPLIWQPEEDAARASHEEAARKQRSCVAWLQDAPLKPQAPIQDPVLDLELFEYAVSFNRD